MSINLEDEDFLIFHAGRTVGYFDAVIEFLDSGTVLGHRVAMALFARCAAKGYVVEKELRDLADAIQDLPLGEALDRVKDVDLDPVLFKAVREYCAKTQQHDIDYFVTVYVKRKSSDPTDPETFNKVRVELILKDLDVTNRATLFASERVDFETVKKLEEKMAVQFKALAQYGIEAKTLADAQRQYREQYVETKGKGVEERIQEEIARQVTMNVELEALKARLCKQYPEHADFISREIRKEQSRRRTAAL